MGKMPEKKQLQTMEKREWLSVMKNYISENWNNLLLNTDSRFLNQQFYENGNGEAS